MVICCFDGEGLFLVINVVMLHGVGPFGGARWGDPLKGISKRAVKRTQGYIGNGRMMSQEWNTGLLADNKGKRKRKKKEGVEATSDSYRLRDT